MNYDRHSAFQSADPAWVVPQDAISGFHGAYQLLCVPGASPKALEAPRNILQLVMGSLAEQAATSEERTFVDELHGQLDRIVKEEFTHYHNCRKLHGLATGSSQKLLADLCERRFTTGLLDTSILKSLCDLARPHIARFQVNVERHKLTREDLSLNHGRVIADMTAVLNEAFRRLGILDAMSAYMGRHFEVGGLALEYSHQAATWWRHSFDGLPCPKTIYAHIDETIAIPKAIVYLTDVDRDNGPISCYPRAYERLELNALQELIGRVIANVGNAETSPLRTFYNKPYHQSMGSPAFRRHFMKLPVPLRFNSHFGWDVMPGSPLETELASCETVFTGPKGTFVAFDGARLLHRGGLVATGSRVALQVVFSPKPSIPVRRRVMSTVRGFLKRPRDLARNLRTRIKGEKFSTVLQSFSRALPQISCIDVGASYFPHEKWRLFLDSPNVHWLAVEPNEANLEYIRHWRWAAIPTVLGTGLSRTGGRQTLFVTNIDSGSSLLPPVFGESMQHRVTDATRSYFYPVREVEVDTLTLADVVAETVPTSPVCVKLDTQGSELEILRGAHDLLSRHRFVGLEIESSLLAEPVMRGGSRFWEVNEYLESLGYELLHIDPIMSGSNFSGPSVRGRRWLNECDAVFMLRRDMVDALPAQYRIALLAFQLAYDFFEEALSILQDDIGVRTLLEESQLPPLMLEKAIGRQLSGGTV